MKNKGLKIASLIGIGSIGAYASLSLVANEVFKKVFVVDDAYLDLDIDEFFKTEELKNKYLSQSDEHINWYKNSKKQNVNVKSYDGLILDGILFKTADNHQYMILVHGYNCDRYILLKQAYEFSKRGFNILLIDQRAYGKSEGEYTTFGFKEHLDLINWIEYISSIDEEARIGLYGVSMGAATVMLALGTKVNDKVRFAIEDSGYSNLRDEMSMMIQLEVKHGHKAILNSLNRTMINKLGYGLDDIRPVDALKENEIPICFVHAKNDPVVPYDMAKELYNANKGKKAFYPIDSDIHAYTCYNDEYFDDLMEFIDKYR